MSRLWNLFTQKYKDGIEEKALKILKEAHQASVNPQSPDFIEGDAFGKERRMALNILLSLGFLRKTSDSRDVYIITEEGERVLIELIRIEEKHKKEGKQQNLFPNNGCNKK